MPKHRPNLPKKKPSRMEQLVCVQKSGSPPTGGLPSFQPETFAVSAKTLAVHSTAAAAVLAALSGLLLAALMLLTGLALPALLLLAGFLLAALLRIILLLLRVARRVLLFVRHWDVLRGSWKPPVLRNDNPPPPSRFLASLRGLSVTNCKSTIKLGL
jgi:hypothetical protein